MAFITEDGKFHADSSTVGVQPSPAQQTPPGWFEPGSQSEAALRGFSNAATLGTGKYLGGAINGLINGAPGKSTWQNIVDSVNAEKTANQSAEQANPLTYTAGSLVGGAPVALAAGGGSLPAVLAKQAATSAVQGAADDTTGNPLAAAAKAAAVSGATTGGLGLAGKAVQMVGNKVAPALGNNVIANTISAETKLGTKGTNILRQPAAGPTGGTMVGTQLGKDFEEGGIGAIDQASPAWMQIKNAISANTSSPTSSIFNGAVQGAKESLSPKSPANVAALAAAAASGGLPAAVATQATNAGIRGVGDAVGNMAAKDIVNGGTGKIVGDLSDSPAVQATLQKLTGAIDGDGSNWNTVMSYLNQTDPQVRAATNPDNPLNEDKQ